MAQEMVDFTWFTHTLFNQAKITINTHPHEIVKKAYVLSQKMHWCFSPARNVRLLAAVTQEYCSSVPRNSSMGFSTRSRSIA